MNDEKLINLMQRTNTLLQQLLELSKISTRNSVSSDTSLQKIRQEVGGGNSKSITRPTGSPNEVPWAQRSLREQKNAIGSFRKAFQFPGSNPANRTVLKAKGAGGSPTNMSELAPPAAKKEKSLADRFADHQLGNGAMRQIAARAGPVASGSIAAFSAIISAAFPGEARSGLNNLQSWNTGIQEGSAMNSSPGWAAWAGVTGGISGIAKGVQ